MNSRAKQNQRVGTGRRERLREGGNFIDFPTAAVLVVPTGTTMKSTAAPIFARLIQSAHGRPHRSTGVWGLHRAPT
jgi:hypothetical protein